MKQDANYTFDYQALELGGHIITIPIGDDLFAKYPESEVMGASADAKIELSKHHNFAEMTVQISGYVTLECDRCLDPVELPVEWLSNCIVKVSEFADDDPDIIYLPPSQNMLDLSQYLYESVMLSLPVQRTHPAEDMCNPEVVKHINVKEVETDDSDDE